MGSRWSRTRNRWRERSEPCGSRITQQSNNPYSLHTSRLSVRCQNISSYLVQDTPRKISLSSLLSEPFSALWPQFFSVISAVSMYMCVDSLPLFCFRVSIALDGGRDCTGAHVLYLHDTSFYWRVVSNSGSHVLPFTLPGSSPIGGKKVKGEVPGRIAPPVPFPSPNQHTTLWSALV